MFFRLNRREGYTQVWVSGECVLIQNKPSPILCPDCAHEESKRFTALRNLSISLREVFAKFLNEKPESQLYQ